MQKGSFFLAAFFPNKAFFSKQQNHQSAHLLPGLVHEYLYFCKTEKITRQCPVKSKVTCKNLAHLEAQNKRPKKSLTMLLNMQVPLQLVITKYNNTTCNSMKSTVPVSLPYIVEVSKEGLAMVEATVI